MTLFENIDSPERGILCVGQDQKVVFANRRAARIFGTSVDALVGAELPDHIVHRSVEPEETVEEVLGHLTGEDAIFHRSSTPVYASDGSTVGRVEVYSDITARRRIEDDILARNTKLAQLNRQLEEAQEMLVQSERLRAVGEMAAGTAHDINNVLGIILGNTQLIKRDIDADSEVAQCVEAIELAARDAAETIRRLREIGKPVDRKALRRVDLGSIVQDVVKSTVPTIKDAQKHGGPHLTIRTHLSQGCHVLGNPSELREALNNILINAAQAIDTKGQIRISTSKERSFARVAVKDTGRGMTEETKSRLFDPFYTTRGALGSGLGMSMVSAIAVRHDGHVAIDSREGAGTTVSLIIPLASPYS